MNKTGTSLDGEEFDSSTIGTSVAETSSGVSRHEKSLGLLTSRFVTLLQSAEDGILDLKAVSQSCSVSLFTFFFYLTH